MVLAVSLMRDILQRLNSDWVFVSRHPDKCWLYGVIFLQSSPPVMRENNFRIRIQLPKLWFILHLSNFILTCYHSTYLYLHTRWWMKMQISNLAKFIPGHIRGPLPNPRKLKVLIGACHWKKQIISWSAFRESESWWKNYKLKWAYIKSGGIKLFRICKNFRVMVNRDNIQVNWPTFHDFVPWSSKQFRTTNS